MRRRERRPGSSAAGNHPNRTSVVVGHDGHPSSAAALRTAIELAAVLDAHLHVVHSVTLEDYGIDPDADDFERECAENLTHERARVESTLNDSDLSWTYHEERGDPAACLTILATRHDASLIVIGAGHHGMFRHALAGGSVAQHLLHEQGRPIVVVPVSTDPDGNPH